MVMNYSKRENAREMAEAEKNKPRPCIGFIHYINEKYDLNILIPAPEEKKLNKGRGKKRYKKQNKGD